MELTTTTTQIQKRIDTDKNTSTYQNPNKENQQRQSEVAGHL